MRNEYGLDTDYFIRLCAREFNPEVIRNQRPEDLARALARAARTACAEVLQEREFLPEQPPATAWQRRCACSECDGAEWQDCTLQEFEAAMADAEMEARELFACAPDYAALEARSVERQAVAEELARQLKLSGDEVRRLREALAHMRDTLDGQLELIAARAPGRYLDKTPIVRSLRLHRTRCDEALSAQSEHGEAYQGAREDLAIWKRRALEAEDKLRTYDKRIVGLGVLAMQSAPQSGSAGLVEALAEIVKQYPNPDISHVDYRVHACKHAETALAAYRQEQQP